MAKDKSSFILYTDLLATVSKLTDKKAGMLFKTILEYVNDLNPEVTDTLIQIAFEPVKQQLKRDLKKWDRYIEKQSDNGKLGGRPKKATESQKTQAFYEKPKKADSVSVNVSDSVNDNWDSIKLNFFNGWKWKEKFCTDKKIEMPHLENLMTEFINDVELQEDFKDLKELKKHFINKFNKNGNSATATRSGTSAEKNAAINRF